MLGCMFPYNIIGLVDDLNVSLTFPKGCNYCIIKNLYQISISILFIHVMSCLLHTKQEIIFCSTLHFNLVFILLTIVFNDIFDTVPQEINFIHGLCLYSHKTLVLRNRNCNDGRGGPLGAPHQLIAGPHAAAQTVCVSATIARVYTTQGHTIGNALRIVLIRDLFRDVVSQFSVYIQYFVCFFSNVVLLSCPHATS